MKTEVKKDKQSILGNLYTLTIIKPNIPNKKRYLYYFKKAELLELGKQIDTLFKAMFIVEKKVIGKVGNRTKYRIKYFLTKKKEMASEDVWEEAK